MQSQLLIQYLRTGIIPPLKKGDTKAQVEAKLGLPNDWFGRVRGFTWAGPVLTKPRDSTSWHYGSLCVRFGNPSILRRRCDPYVLRSHMHGISLVYDYAGIGTPVYFPDPFSELPQAPFTLREVIELMRDAAIQFADYRDNRDRKRDYAAILVSEGGVGITTRRFNVSPKAQVNWLFPCAYEPD